MTKQEYDNLIEQLEADLEEARDLLRQAEEDENRRMINQAQNDIGRITRRMSQVKYDWELQGLWDKNHAANVSDPNFLLGLTLDKTNEQTIP